MTYKDLLKYIKYHYPNEIKYIRRINIIRISKIFGFLLSYLILYFCITFIRDNGYVIKPVKSENIEIQSLKIIKEFTESDSYASVFLNIELGEFTNDIKVKGDFDVYNRYDEKLFTINANNENLIKMCHIFAIVKTQDGEIVLYGQTPLYYQTNYAHIIQIILILSFAIWVFYLFKIVIDFLDFILDLLGIRSYDVKSNEKNWISIFYNKNHYNSDNFIVSTTLNYIIINIKLFFGKVVNFEDIEKCYICNNKMKDDKIIYSIYEKIRNL